MEDTRIRLLSHSVEPVNQNLIVYEEKMGNSDGFDKTVDIFENLLNSMIIFPRQLK